MSLPTNFFIALGKKALLPLPSQPTTTNTNLRFWLFNKSDASTYSHSVTDYLNNVGNDYQNVPWAGAMATDFQNLFDQGGAGGSVLLTGPVFSGHATSAPFTVEFWYYLAYDDTTVSPMAFNDSTGGNQMTILFNYGVGMRSLGTHSIDMYNNNNVDFTNKLATGSWHHFMYKWDGSYGSCWVDGQPEVTQASASSTNVSFLNSAQLLIGNEADAQPVSGSGNLFPGLIADLRVWDIDAYPNLAYNGTFTPATSYSNHPEQNM